MNLRGLILLALVVCLCTATAQAAKMDGEIRSINGQLEVGWARFDISAIPDGDTVTAIEFHFYVNDTYFPYWSITPMTSDPLTADGPTLWADITAEMDTGYYNHQTESSTYAPGWKQLTLGGTAVVDLQTDLADDWFPLGIVETDGGTSLTYYLYIDGRTDTNPPYLVVTHSSGPTTCNPTAATYGTGTVMYIGACCYNDGSCDDLTESECMAAGGVYQGDWTECATTTCPVGPDCNDYLQDLGTIACPSSTTVTGDTIGELDACGNDSSEMHYTFTVPDGGLYTFTTCNADTAYDTYLRLYDDACCGNEIAFNDDDDSCAYLYRSTLADIPLVPGQYYLQVEGFSTAQGYFELNISGAVPTGPTTLRLSPDKECYQIGDTVEVDIDLVTPTTAIVGGQFFLEYDTTALDFISIAVGDTPFDSSILETVDEVAGTIDYAVHAPFASGGTIGDTTMARLTFTALRQICADSGVITFRPHEPPTRLSDYHGQTAPAVLVDLDLVDTEAPVLTCPADITVECDLPTEPTADWEHKMHFPQEPDPLGWDVNADYLYDGVSARILADDWMCSETGLIENVRFWGSWQGDNIGTITQFYLYIYSDVPAGVDAPYSHPGSYLWGMNLFEGDFTVTEVFPSSDQGWFDPVPVPAGVHAQRPPALLPI